MMSLLRWAMVFFPVMVLVPDWPVTLMENSYPFSMAAARLVTSRVSPSWMVS